MKLDENINSVMGVENEKTINNNIMFNTCPKHEDPGIWGGAASCQVGGSH